MADFIPPSDPDFNIWLGNWSTQLGLSGTSVGLTAGRVTTLQGNAAGWQAALADVAVKLADYQAAVQNKNTLRAATEAEVRDAAKDIKDSTAYTPAIGEDYDIVAETPAFDPATYKTTLKVRIVAAKPEVSWTKGGAHGVAVYGRLSGQLTFIKLGNDARSPFRDERPLATPGQPEHREYMGRGLIDDQEIGVDSDIVSVVFSG